MRKGWEEGGWRARRALTPSSTPPAMVHPSRVWMVLRVAMRPRTRRCASHLFARMAAIRMSGSVFDMCMMVFSPSTPSMKAILAGRMRCHVFLIGTTMNSCTYWSPAFR